MDVVVLDGAVPRYQVVHHLVALVLGVDDIQTVPSPSGRRVVLVGQILTLAGLLFLI